MSQQYKLPIFSIVLDNSGWNAVKQSTLRVFPEGEAKAANSFEAELAPKVAFTKVGEAFGAYAEEVTDPADVPAAIARCAKEVRGGRAALLHARVTRIVKPCRRVADARQTISPTLLTTLAVLPAVCRRASDRRRG